MLNPKDFREHIIKPTLEHLGMYSLAAENLLIGTAVQESGLRHLKQIGGGPALGVYQIEPETHTDLWCNYLSYRTEMMSQVERHAIPHIDTGSQLIGNLYYATAIARIIYYRRPEPLPDADDIEGLAGYWKNHFNTVAGKGTAAAFRLNYKEHCLWATR